MATIFCHCNSTLISFWCLTLVVRSPISSKDTTKIFDQAQFYRIFVCNLTFSSLGELIFGSLALFPLMRRFEREVRMIL